MDAGDPEDGRQETRCHVDMQVVWNCTNNMAPLAACYDIKTIDTHTSDTSYATNESCRHVHRFVGVSV